MEPKKLSLPDYSNKYGVSISTIRRRIKNGELEVEAIEGRYYISDKPLSLHSNMPLVQIKNAVPIPTKIKSFSSEESHKGLSSHLSSIQTPKVQESLSQNTKLNPSQLLDELKKAYTQVLQEKEEQIQLCKEEIADLQTLVRVLESENERQKRIIGDRQIQKYPLEYYPEGIDIQY
jgi:hypothetical protein